MSLAASQLFVRARWSIVACALIAILPLSSSAFASQDQVPGTSAQTGQSRTSPVATPKTPAPVPQSSPSSSASRNMHCPTPANPRRRYTRCKDEPFDWDETFSRDYLGLREKMKQLGITPSMSYTGVLQTNITGQTHQIWGYAGQLVAGFNVDLEKLLRIRGMSVYVAGSWGTGDNLSGSLDNLFPVNTLYAPSYYLGEMYLQQTLLHQNLTLLGGRIAAGNTFAELPVFANYVNYGLNPNPYPLGYNDITFFAPPTGTEWGAQASYNISTVFQLDAGMFNTNRNAANGQNHGTDWTLQQGNKGALVIAQASYFPHGITADQGRQGVYTVGVIGNNNMFPALPDKVTQTVGYVGAFVLGQETVYQPDGPNTSRGLTVWGSWAYNATPLVSPIPLFWAGGASFQGVFKRRADDAASIDWIYGRVSNYFPNAGAEQVLEVNYRVVYRKFLVITPDFQYIWSPGGRNAPGVTVAGIQAAITF